MLYLIATPIGNLKDISIRAIEILKESDYILCEDSRHSRILLDYYQVVNSMRPFHRFNEKKLEKGIVEDLKKGYTIALISNAGTPAISDPGESLVQRCYKENLPVRSIPGASAWLLALSLTPFSKESIQFLGFLSKKKEERQKKLAYYLHSPSITIFYESPHRLVDTLRQLPPNRKVAIMRELTKKFEEHYLGTAEESVVYFEKNKPQGEFVVVVEKEEKEFLSLLPEEHVASLQKEYGIPLTTAIKIAAQLRGKAKREIYNDIVRKG